MDKPEVVIIEDSDDDEDAAPPLPPPPEVIVEMKAGQATMSPGPVDSKKGIDKALNPYTPRNRKMALRDSRKGP